MPRAARSSILSSLSAIEVARPSELILQQLRQLIGSGGLRPGDRLPAERELMTALAVGRSTIREAIRHFQALGVIETRKGSGTYLLKPVSRATIHMPLSLDTVHLRDVLLQTLEVRRGIECEAGMVAARRRTNTDLVVIEEKLNEMERVHIEKGTSGPEDLAFHLAVYDATHNPLYARLAALQFVVGDASSAAEESLPALK